MGLPTQQISARTLAWLIFGGSVIIYCLTSCRTVYVGDSGELSLVLTTGGIAHPPGYPLYTILGYIWLMLFFFLRPAMAATLFSAVAVAASAALLYRLLDRVNGPNLPRIVTAATALLFAFAAPVWYSAVQAEVYALSGLLFIGALYAVLEFYHSGRTWHLLIAAFLCGLVMTHHFSASVVIAALVLAIIFKRDSIRSPRSIAMTAFAFLLPLTLYFYLLLRFDPALPVNWLGERSISGLWSVVSGENYRQFVGTPTLGDIMLFIRELAEQSFMYFGPGLILLAPIGLIFGLRKNVRQSLLVAVPAILVVFLICNYRIPDYEGYLIPWLTAAAIFVSLGISWFYAVYRISAPVTGAIAGVLVFFPLLTNYSDCTLSGFSLAERYGRDLLDSAPPGATLILKSDNAAHTGLYLRYGEGYRQDIEVYSSNSTMTRLAHDFGVRDIAEAMDSVLAHTDDIYWGVEYIINQGMNPSPGEKAMRGMLYGPARGGDDATIAERLDRFTVDILPALDPGRDVKAWQICLEYRLRVIDRLIMEGEQSELPERIGDLFRWGQNLDHPRTCLAVAQFFTARGLIDEGLRWVELAREANPTSREEKDLYVNLGIIYRRAGDLSMAHQSLLRALEIDADYGPARYNVTLVKAEMALQRQDWQAALEAFTALTRLEPTNPLPYFNMAVICERLPGQEEMAIRYYRKFISSAGDEHREAVQRAQARINVLDSTMATPLR